MAGHAWASVRRAALLLLVLLLVLGCDEPDECQPEESPCGAQPGTFLTCFTPHPNEGAVLPSRGNVFEHWQCEGIVPACRPVGEHDHECVDEGEPEACASRVVIEHVLPRTTQAIEWTDVDGDGTRDLLFTCRQHRLYAHCGLWLARGLAVGGFAEPVEIGSYRDDVVELIPRLGDVDGDGTRDLVVQWTAPPPPDARVGRPPDPITVEILLGDGVGFAHAAQREFDGYSDLQAVHDLDGDGSAELLLTTGTGVSILALQDGALAEREHFEIDRDVFGGFMTIGLTLADFEGGAEPYLLVDVGGGGYLAYGVRDGRYTRVPAAYVSSDTAFGDFDGDGATDLVAIGLGTRPPLDVQVSARDGTFSPHTSPRLPYDGVPLAGDFTGDGQSDVAVVHAAGLLSVLVSKGKGGLAAPRTFAIDRELETAPIVLDVDDDGRDDLVELEFVPKTGALTAIAITSACL